MKMILKRTGDFIQDVADAVFLLLAAFICYLFFEVWETIRRKLIILIWGYGGDAVVFLKNIPCAVIEGLHAFLDREYACEKLDCSIVRHPNS